ncbi:hypothetical protein TCAL_17194 [Tigriopus californicus]|uniref:MATH domain-containing protein n=1 Tax=Tigriopus californicus TaxID=6832 RepID=A0A553N6I6_TIGCA|nr:hypothetical protein TCAL_17194 [Tigriopus californicus]
MALLHRFLRLNDHKETGIFTFIVTKNVTRDSHRDVTSKDFWYGYHRWAVAFSRHEKTVGIYLVWRNASEGMKVTLDFNLILLNRDHFSQNQIFNRKRVKFSHESPGNETTQPAISTRRSNELRASNQATRTCS